MAQGPIEEVAASLGFDYDTAAFRQLDAHVDLIIGSIEILGDAARAVSKHIATAMRAAGMPTEALDASVEELGTDLDATREKAARLRREFGKAGQQANEAGDEAKDLGRKAKAGTDEAKTGVMDLIGGLGLLGLAYGAISWAQQMGEAAQQVRVLSQSMGISVESASEWTTVARTVGAGAEDLQGVMAQLSERFLDAANGGQDAKDMLEALGIAIPSSASEIPDAEEQLLLMADGLASIQNPAERAARASQMLGDAGVKMLPFLSRGRAGIEAMRKRVRELGGGLSTEGIANIEAFQGSLVYLNVAFESLFDFLAKKFLPVLTDLVDDGASVVSWFREVAENSHILESLFAVLAAGAAYFGATALAAWISATWPALLAVAAVLLLAAAIDDLWVGLEGGDSLIGRVLDHFLGVGAASDFFRALREGWESVVAFVTGTVAPYFLGLWEGLKPTIMGVRDVALALFRRISAAVTPLAEMLLSMWERIREPVTNILGFIFRALRWLAVKIGETLGGVFTVLGAGLTSWWEMISGIIQRVVGLLDRLGVLDALGGVVDILGEAAGGFEFSTDTPTGASSTGLSATVDPNDVTRPGSARQEVNQVNNLTASINLPNGVTEEQARRLGREAAQGLFDEQNEALLDMEATAAA